MLGNESSDNLGAQVTPSCPEDREELDEPLTVAAAPEHRENLRPGSTECGDLEQRPLGKRSLKENVFFLCILVQPRSI